MVFLLVFAAAKAFVLSDPDAQPREVTAAELVPAKVVHIVGAHRRTTR